jgi:hypothetical protein
LTREDEDSEESESVFSEGYSTAIEEENAVEET